MDLLWPSLAAELKKELPAQQFDTWIKPLRAERRGEQLLLLAPNHHVLRWVRSNLLAKIESRLERVAGSRLSVDLVLDVVGAPYWEQNMDCLAPDGRIVLIATMGGRLVEGLDLSADMRKRAWVAGTTLRARGPGYKVRLTREFARHALPRFADGRLRSVVDRVFDWTDAAGAHRYMEENRNVGKIVLTGM